MSDIVERLRGCCERANGVNCPDAYGAHTEPHDMCERCHAAAEIERLRAGERAADAEIERLRLWERGADREMERLSALALERTEEVLRLRAAEAQRDALVRAAAPIIAETAREDRDDYRVRVKTVDIRALSAAVADARGAGGEG